jgi:streptomycin 6-kinase
MSEAIVLDDWFRTLLRARGTEFPAAYVEKALGFYAELTSKSPLAYLHGDFHPGNIVTATRSPYLAIDPKGIIGPIGYDVAVFLNNLYGGQGENVDHSAVRQMLAASIAQFSAALSISQRDLRRWAFAVRVLGAWWTFDEMPALYSGGVVKADIWDV